MQTSLCLSLGLKSLTTSSSVHLKDEVITVAYQNLPSVRSAMVHLENLYYLQACSDGKPIQRTTDRMYPLQYYSGLQKHPGK